MRAHHKSELGRLSVTMLQLIRGEKHMCRSEGKDRNDKTRNLLLLT